MARTPHQGEELRPPAGLPGRHLQRPGGSGAQVPHPLHLRGAHGRHQSRVGQLHLHPPPGCRHSADGAVCALRGARQYQPWRHARALRHIAEQEPPEAAQHLHVGHRLVGHHRLRRFGRCRGSYRLHGRGYRLEPRASVPHVAAHPDDTRGLRSRRRYRRYLQGTYRRYAFHPRGAHARPHHRVGHAASDSLHHQHYHSICLHGLRVRVLLRPDRGLLHLAYSLRDTLRGGQRLRLALFHPGDEHDGELLRPLQEPVAQDADGLLHSVGPRIRLSPSLRRRLRRHRGAARRRYVVDSERLALLQRPQLRVVPGCVHRTYHPHQSLRHLVNQRRRRCGRHLRPLALRGVYDRLPLRLHHQPSGIHRTVDQELRPHRHGRCDERRHARSADGHLPHGRAYRRLRALPAAADSEHHIVRHHQDIRAVLHLHHATGQARRAPHPSEGPGRAHPPENQQCHRDRLPPRLSRDDSQGHGRHHSQEQAQPLPRAEREPRAHRRGPP